MDELQEWRVRLTITPNSIITQFHLLQIREAKRSFDALYMKDDTNRRSPPLASSIAA
jgi:hypothetical protein